VKFRDAGSLLVPYVELNLAQGEKGLPIREVVVGPTPHPRLELRGLSALLGGAGLPDAKVGETETPYRDW